MKRYAFLFAILFSASSGSAQDPPTGFPPYGSFEDGRFDGVNRQNLNVNFAIPVVSNAGRGMTFSFALVHDSLIWKRQTTGPTTTWTPVTDGNGQPTWGWKKDYVPGRISWTSTTQTIKCFDGGPWYWGTRTRYNNYVYLDPTGTAHRFTVNFSVNCDSGFISGAQTGDDGNGYYLDATMPEAPTVYGPGGAKMTNAGGMTDTNGNMISPIVVSSSETHWKDSVGRISLKIIRQSTYTDYQFLDTNGTYQTIRMNFQTFNIKTNFACADVVEYTGTANLPISIALPNDQSYSFTYEATPGPPGFVTGRILRGTLPTGGYYEYQYPQTGNNGINCADASVTSLTRVISDGASPVTWTFARTQVGSDWKTTVTAPVLSYDNGVANQSTFTFNSSGQLISQQFYQGSEAPSNLKRTISTTWAANGTPASRTVILEDGVTQSKTDTTFDTYGNLTQWIEYDWGSGAPGAAIRTITITYLSTTPYTARNIRNRPTQILVRQGGPTGSIKSQTDIFYDETTPSCVSGVPEHDDAGYGCSFNIRGNPTTVKRYKDATTFLPATQTYDILGNITSATDAGGHTTSLSYVDNYHDGLDRNSRAYLTQMTKPAPFQSQIAQFKYNYHIGMPKEATDENSRITSFEYLDPLNRPTKIDFPDQGQITAAYNDASRTETTTQKRTTTDNLVVTELYNQLGQLIQRQLPGSRKVDITYDVLGRVWKATNPYLTTGDLTYGFTEAQFDALGRIKALLNQDGDSVQIDYAQNAVKVTDETGKKRLNQIDALGRVTKVCEVTLGNSRSPAAPCSINGFSENGYATTNSYDVLDNLTQVVQGSQTRTSSYDFLSRLTASRIIEVSTTTDVTYGYDNDSNMTSVTDPRGTVYFENDELHRLKRKKHGTTVVASYSYDGTQANNAIGRLITQRDGDFGSNADKTDYTYDVMGRVLSANRTVSGITYAMGYTYDLMGNLLTLSYPSSSGIRRKVEYTFNANGELFQAKDITGTAFDYVTNTTYSPLGTISQLDLGNGVRTTLGWTKRGLVSSVLSQKVGGSANLNLTYSYYLNGQIQEIMNSLDGLKTEKYTYDQLQRLFTAQRGPDQNIQRKYEYDYDRYGNRWAQTVVAGSGLGGTNSFDATNNRVTSPGFSYVNGSGQDQAGNLTANGAGSSYTYSWENFLTAAGSTTYVYDAQGRRVKKTASGTTTEYFYVGSEVLSEKQGSTWTDYIFFGGQRIAKQTAAMASTATYLHTDHLRSTRVCTDANGNANGTCHYEPFGEIQPGTSCSVPTNFRFAGMEWDADAGPNGLYHTWFRQYDVNQGRWMSVDPLPGSADEPQSLNRYAYVRNDPVNFIDPLGLRCMIVWNYTWFEGIPGIDRWDVRPGYYLSSIDSFCFRDPGDPGDPPCRGPQCREDRLEKPKPPAAKPRPCFQPKWLQRLGIRGQAWIARKLGTNVGIGAGISGGVGNRMGVAGNASRQMVVSPNGQAALVTTFGSNATPIGPTQGAGFVGGIQISLGSPTTDPQQLAGFSVDIGGGYAAGPGFGFDLSGGSAGIEGTLTLGGGLGRWGGAALYQVSSVTPVCQQ